jgi:hypothetical protein
MPKLMPLLDLIKEVEGDPEKLKEVRQQLVDRFNEALARIDEADVKRQAAADDDEPTATPDEGGEDDELGNEFTNDDSSGVQVVVTDDAFAEVHVTHFHFHF